MKKQIILRGLIGIPIGICIGYLITLIVSAVIGDGQFHSATPELIDQQGSELSAVLFQTLLSALLGLVFGASSVIWELDHWSILKQTGIYFLITLMTMLSISYIAGWMEPSIKGLVIYMGIFIGIFIITWLIQYLIWKNKVKTMNQKMKNK